MKRTSQDSAPVSKRLSREADLKSIAEGSTHQANPKFRGAGRQCTAMASVACAYSVVNRRSSFSLEEFDLILESGDDLYMALEPFINGPNRFLMADEIPTEIRVGQNLVKIENVRDNYLTAGLYPRNRSENDVSILELKNDLDRNVFNSQYTERDGAIFTGSDYTVAIWRHNNKYYLFNSHAVDFNNKSDANGVARVFEMDSTYSLAKALLEFNPAYGSQYSISKIRVVSILPDNEIVLSDITECSMENSLPYLISNVDSIKNNKINIPNLSRTTISTQSLTQCSRSSVSKIELDSPSVLSSFKNSNEMLTTPVIIKDTQKITSQISNVSKSILDDQVPRLSQKHNMPYADIVKINLQKTTITPNLIKRTAQNVIVENRTNLQPVVVIDRVDDFKLSYLKPVVVVEPLKSLAVKQSIPSTLPKKGRPIKNKRGRKVTKDNAHLDAVTKYSKKKPEKNREAVKKYTENKPYIHREAVKKYTENKPDIHREAVKKYTETNPDVHHKAVSKYDKENPDVHRNAAKKYNETHPEVIQQSKSRYEKDSRNVEKSLRRSENLISEKSGEQLNSVKAYNLKNQSLKSTNTYVCPHCHAPLFHEEKSRKMWCCSQNKNNVLNLAPLTEEFYSHPAFEARPRAYNNMFAFSALGVSHGSHNPRGYFSFIKIQGRIYHRVFDLAYNTTANNLGLYINELGLCINDRSEREKLAEKQSLDLVVIRCIKNFLHNVNPFIECFKRLNEETSDEAFIQFENTSRPTHGNILGDKPVGREISAIINTDRDQYVPRSIAIWKVGARKPHTVDILHPLYESFQYPLLYPEGNAGWYPNKLNNNGEKLTQARYVRCLLLSDCRFSEFQRLSEEWMVDMYCRISEERLRYILNMQTNRNNRSAPLQELLNDETIVAEGVVPGRIYLPNSFTGSPRYMKLKYLDCIAIVNKFGPPTFFVTFTCNPKWPEIVKSTPEGQRPNPLICCRVFNLRLTELFHDIRCNNWFGNLLYKTHVIEYQKRGLPHAHICFKVEGGPLSNIDIDKICRADIPAASEADGRLQKAVLEHMIHGPCGPDRDDLPCYDKTKNTCSKRFPKRETDVTFYDERGFVHLKRSSKNTIKYKHGHRVFDISDLNVVPYNASLLLKYDAHINVEVSSHRSIVKYIFKYMTKGADMARTCVTLTEDLSNEIENFVTIRYIGSCEAAWRILEFDVTAREPNVKQLSVHLENQQTVHFRTDSANDVVQVVQSSITGGSDLLTYFKRPEHHEFENLKYTEFYEKYIVHTKRPSTTKVTIFETTDGKYFVTARQKGELIARLFWVAPKQGEQFYLRILLNAFACRGYADLLKLGGPDCKTFQEAARAVGLADDGGVEYENAMQEASTFYTGPRLRKFFVLLAVNGVPVASLWSTFKNQLSEDILQRMPDEIENAHNTCLIQINRLLRKHGSSLASIGLPEVHDGTTELGRERIEHDTEQQIAVVDEWMPKLSPEQLAVFKYINRLCVDRDFRETNSCAIFIDGPAGTGKTTLLNTITAHIRGNLKGVAICVASSAVAANGIAGATTAHAMFRFPLDVVDDTGYWNITNKTQRAELIYHADVIIYDEAPMAHKYLIHMLDRSLQDLMQSNKIFGGKVIIFAGDFRQIPPVVVDAKSNSDILNSSLKTSPLWQNLKTFSLVTSQRCRDDPEYADFLLKLGSNEIPSIPVQIGRGIQRIVSLDSIEHVSELEELIDFVFSNAIVDEPDVCALRAILCTRNDAVQEINAMILDRVSGDMLHFYAQDKLENDANADELYLGTDTLNKSKPQGFPDFDLKLKVGCVCMITRNLSFADGLVNGTKVIIVETSPRLITVRKKGCYENIPYLIPRILFKAPIYRNSPFEMSRRQFPLQVCYAITVHKSQGQTLTRVGVDLRSDVFSHGMLYVALGRVQSKCAIKILVHKNRVINGIPYANNVIIPELIS